ncbi:melanopsin-like [Lineus longissimus]|uniref:melanopsin-like n=1 Tax=Lineus longissimus TaxID=88925 RepID=UPI00315D140F
MASIAAERYLTVTKRSQSWRVARMQGFRCVMAVWVSAFLIAVPNIVLLSDSSANTSQLRNSICNLDVNQYETSVFDILYPIYFLVVCLLAPVCVTTYCYCKLYFMVRHVARRVRISRMSVIAMTVTGTEGTTVPAPGTSAGPQDEVKTERIIAKRMIFMVLVTFLSWLPYSLTEIAVIGMHYRIPLTLRILPSVFAKGCILYNPLIYIAFSKKFRQSFKDYLQCKWGKKSRVQAIRGAVAPAASPRLGMGKDIRMERSSFMRQKTFPLLNQQNMIHEAQDPGNGQRYLDPGGNTTSGYGTASLTPTAYLSRTPMPSNSLNPSTQVTYLDPSTNSQYGNLSSQGGSSFAAKSPARVKISLPETQMRTAMLLRKDTEETFRFIHEARPQPRRKNGMSTLQVPSLSGLVIPASHRQIKVQMSTPLPGVPDNSDSRDSSDPHVTSKT